MMTFEELSTRLFHDAKSDHPNCGHILKTKYLLDLPPGLGSVMKERERYNIPLFQRGSRRI